MSLLLLPNELLTFIFDHLEAVDILQLTKSCRALALLCSSDSVWKRISERELGLTACTPYATWKLAYRRLFKHRWLKYGLWHGDTLVVGKVAVSKYDVNRGTFIVCMVGSNKSLGTWCQAPRQSLITDTPLMIVSPCSCQRYTCTEDHYIRRDSSFGVNMEMRLVRATATPKEDYEGVEQELNFVNPTNPSIEIWPPLSVPAEDRVVLTADGRLEGSSSSLDDPQLLSPSIFQLERRPLNARYHTIETFSRLQDDLIVPTAKRPLSGIWVGGKLNAQVCHFVLVIYLHESGTDSLQGTKLTGEPGWDRGYHDFIVNDLSQPVEGLYTECGDNIQVYNAYIRVPNQDGYEGKYKQLRYVSEMTNKR